MYKLLIVDDEPIIREGIAALINWEKYGFSHVAIAESAEDAIEKYEAISPDLMIVDVKMPGMTGMQLIEIIKEKDPSVYFIILSGYAEFEYAKKAIHLGVEEYLLKPVVEEELIACLEKLKPKMMKEKNMKLLLNKQYNQEREERIIHSILKKELDSDVERYVSQLNNEMYRILLVHMSHQSNIEKCKHVFKREFEECRKLGIVFTFEQFIGVFFTQRLRNTDKLYNDVKELIHGRFSVAISDEVMHIQDIASEYFTLSALLKKSFFYETQTMLTNKSIPAFPLYMNNKQQQKTFTLNRSLDSLCYTVELGDFESVKKQCYEMAKQLLIENPDEKWVKKNFIQLLSELVNRFVYEHQELTHSLDNIISKIIEIDKQISIQHLLQYIYSIVETIIEKIDVNSSDVIVKKMMNLINRHYNTNIKLDTLASTLNYHPTYLGKLFKEQTGEYFNTYLDKIRIENSKKLLMKNYKVYQVAERVGYGNVDYFHGKFKKYVGISPSEYKKKNLQGK